jgi:hypothetical protein
MDSLLLTRQAFGQLFLGNEREREREREMGKHASSYNPF